MTTFHAFVALQGRGVLSLPKELRERYGLDQPGAQVEITERPDGTLELKPTLPVRSDQAWFWTQRWQQMEREVDEHVSAGNVTRHESSDDFLAHLDKLATDSE